VYYEWLHQHGAHAYLMERIDWLAIDFVIYIALFVGFHQMGGRGIGCYWVADAIAKISNLVARRHTSKIINRLTHKISTQIEINRGWAHHTRKITFLKIG